MNKKPVSVDTYCKRTINDAAKNLSPEAAEQLIRAFKATRTLDVYGGELTQYLIVIACRLEDANKYIEELKTKIAKIKSDVANL